MPPSKENSELTEEVAKHETLFNPGKLADETQLGSITSLINIGNQSSNNFTKAQHVTDAENITATENLPSEKSLSLIQLSPPVSSSSLSVPPKPFKKRVIHQNKDNKNIVRSIFSIQDDSCSSDSGSTLSKYLTTESLEKSESLARNINNNLDANIDSNVTKQELINKVVDHMCTANECVTCRKKQKKTRKEHRTSVRSCKGLRYAKFMAEGKLLVNKRSKKLSGQFLKVSTEEVFQVPRRESIELTETIKKLAERTSKPGNLFGDKLLHENHSFYSKSELYEENMKKMFRAADFNLDEKIEALPSLSLEKFQQKKKDSKKKKIFRNVKSMEFSEHKKEQFELTAKQNENNNILIGSRKRKPRKQSITRLDLQSDIVVKQQPDVDLFALATLAEVAAKKAKIDQQ